MTFFTFVKNEFEESFFDFDDDDKNNDDNDNQNDADNDNQNDDETKANEKIVSNHMNEKKKHDFVKNA